MKAIRHQGVIDVSAYADYLRTIESRLPANALNFAADKNHYDFYGNYCTHDLELSRIEILNQGTEITYALFFDKNEYKHVKNLTINYTGVQSFKINRHEEGGDCLINDLVIDEISLDEESGLVIHEMQFLGAEIYVLCRDVIAEWQ